MKISMKEKLEEIRYNSTIKNIEYLYYMVPFKFKSEDESYELEISETTKVIRGDNYNNNLKTKEILNPYIQVIENNECVLFNCQKTINKERTYIPGFWEEEINEFVKKTKENSVNENNKVLTKKI